MPDFIWDQLNYFQSGEWQVVQERLDDRDKRAELYNPRRELMFAALDATPFSEVKVAIIGQDPYPDRNCACGIAFSIPNGTIPSGVVIPPTLDNIFKEYVNDLHYPYPTRTDLLPWASKGVLLWNAIPSCGWRKSMSHDWPEWEPLTREIITRLSLKRDIVFAFMGGVARRHTGFVNTTHNTVLETSHPVPRANIRSTQPFVGSRIFTRINDALVQTHRKDPVDWRL
jgi:uracil-DNA glycosylase